MTANTWTDGADPGELALSYARHAGTLRGAVRQALVTRGLFAHLPAAPQRVLDIGGGTGHQAIALARAGHSVVLLDPDEAALGYATQALSVQPAQVRDRVRVVPGRGEDAAELVGSGFDAACCHGVLMYLRDPHRMLAALGGAVRPGGLLSIVTKNGEALAMRPGLEGRWADAIAVLDSDAETGNLGVASRGDTVEGISAALAGAGVQTVAWYGVRALTDHLRDTPVGADFDQIVDAEWAVGQRDPYRRVARLFHLVARRSGS
jgi:S-adenosylmethionine-dependent methyltransferase